MVVEVEVVRSARMQRKKRRKLEAMQSARMRVKERRKLQMIGWTKKGATLTKGNIGI